MHKLIGRRIKVDILFKDNKIKTITDLRINFSTSNTNKEDPNSTNINIYNLSRESISQLENAVRVILYAGYSTQDELSVIATGDVYNFYTDYSTVDIITTIELADSLEVLKNTRISISLGENCTAKEVLDEALQTLNLPIKNDPRVKTLKYPNGYIFVGAVSKLISDISHDVLLQAHYDKETVSLVDRDSVVFRELLTIININEGNGLVETPMRNVIDSGDGDNKTIGWKIKTLLDPRAEVGATVSLTSKVLPDKTGDFIVQNFRHTGDNFDDEFTTEWEVL